MLGLLASFSDNGLPNLGVGALFHYLLSPNQDRASYTLSIQFHLLRCGLTLHLLISCQQILSGESRIFSLIQYLVNLFNYRHLNAHAFR
ncbi:Uncharacterised protein [Vibrio cholerae]|nr:Uncharacterised protein [Vibrio cholerae]